jgi:hypothetical protein
VFRPSWVVPHHKDTLDFEGEGNFMIQITAQLDPVVVAARVRTSALGAPPKGRADLAMCKIIWS